VTPPLKQSPREYLLTQQLGQVREIAWRVHARLPQHVPLEDLIHAGVVGLIDALEKFDLSKSVPFDRYAKVRIRGAIIDSLRQTDWAPRDLRCQSRLLDEARDKLRLKLCRDATEPELAHAMGVPLSEVQSLIGDLASLAITSLNEVSPDGEVRDLCEKLSADPGDTPLRHLLRSEVTRCLGSALRKLAKREYQVLDMYYFSEMKMKEIATVMGVGEARISQIHSAAILRLRTHMADVDDDAEAMIATVGISSNANF